MTCIPHAATVAGRAAARRVATGSYTWDLIADEVLKAAAPLIDAAGRERTLAMLRRAAAGKREYASRGGPDDITARMEMAALGYESAADLITDPRHILDVIPSWQWTEAERASLYEKDGA